MCGKASPFRKAHLFTPARLRLAALPRGHSPKKQKPVFRKVKDLPHQAAEPKTIRIERASTSVSARRIQNIMPGNNSGYPAIFFDQHRGTSPQLPGHYVDIGIDINGGK